MTSQLPKLPGETDPDFARVVHAYLQNFNCYTVKKNLAVRQDLYEWCGNNLGEKYKDWFIFEGGKTDKHWAVNIRDPKKGIWFVLRWNDILIESLDRQR